mgnify:CR=1 FL=1
MFRLTVFYRTMSWCTVWYQCDNVNAHTSRFKYVTNVRKESAVFTLCIL